MYNFKIILNYSEGIFNFQTHPHDAKPVLFSRVVGRGPIMDYTGKLLPKGILFQDSGIRKGRDFNRWSIWRGREGNLSFRAVKRSKKANRCILWLWKGGENVLFLLFNQQLMNEAEHLMKNYGDRWGCYRPRRITPSKISLTLLIIRKPN